jgi:hypothetical protein
VNVEEVGAVGGKEGGGRKGSKRAGKRKIKKNREIKILKMRERKVEQGKDMGIDIWTEWKRKIDNNRLKKKS